MEKSFRELPRLYEGKEKRRKIRLLHNKFNIPVYNKLEGSEMRYEEARNRVLDLYKIMACLSSISLGD
jgi:hypothetical protein